MRDLVSVILINAGRDDDLVAAAHMVREHDWRSREYEIVIAEVGTAMAARRDINSLVDDVHWLTEARFGVGRLRNAAARLSRGDYLLFLDTDTRLHEGAVAILVEYLQRNPKAGLAAPMLVDEDGSCQASARRFYDVRTVIARRLPRIGLDRSALIGRHLMLDCAPDRPRAVDWVLGACMLMRRETFAQVGPFSEASAFGFEDVEWCWRAGVASWEVHYVPNAVVTHRHMRSSAGLNLRTLQHAFGFADFYLRHRVMGPARASVAHRSGEGRRNR